MYRSPDNLRLLRDKCGCDLAYATPNGVSAATLAAEAGCFDSLRFLLDEVGVDDADGRLRAELARLAAASAARATTEPVLQEAGSGTGLNAASNSV